MEIRILHEDDAEQYWKLRLEALKNNGLAFAQSYEEAIQRKNPIEGVKENLRSSSAITFGAWDNDELIGTVTLVLRTHLKLSHKAMIVAMYVTEQARGRGIAKLLLNAAIEKSRSLHLEALLLAVVSTNTPAHSLYKRIGFTVYGTEKRAVKFEGDYYDEYLMELLL